jgi:PAS domain S-box-containing protein
MRSQLLAGRSIQTQLLGAVQEAIIATDLDGTIVYWNPFATQLYGWSAEEVLGRNIMEIVVSNATRTHASQIMESVKKGRNWTGDFEVRRKDGTTFPAQITDAPIFDEHGAVVGVVGISRDLSEQKEAEKALKQSQMQLESMVQERTKALRLLSARLLHMQDNERRRIARELHDSLGQYLAVLAMNLAQLSDADQKRRTHLISECNTIVTNCLSETRTLSHLLHPPLLDESGLLTVIPWYVEGFAQRSGIAVKLNLPKEEFRLPGDIEIVLFRILQESLTNVHRHAKSSVVEIELICGEKQVTLQIKDNGNGIPEDRLQRFTKNIGGLGVGLAGMRERVLDLKGHLDIISGTTGTTVSITIPLIQGTGTAMP